MRDTYTTDVAVLIPAWNERPNLEVLLPELNEILTKLRVKYEVIVVDGGSHDGTQELVPRLGARLVTQTERGYGGALLAGFAAAHSPYIITMDADLSHRPVFIEEFWRRRTEAEVLIASRYVPGGKAEMSGFRRILSGILNVTFGILLSLPVRDLSSGFRMYQRHALEFRPPLARDFDVLEEILILTYHNGNRVLEIPFHYMPRGVGNSHARLFKFGVAYVKTLLRMARLRYLTPKGARVEVGTLAANESEPQ